MRSETKHSSNPIYYLVRQVLNVLSTLYYVIGGIVIFTLVPALSNLQNPWYVMTRLSVLALCLCGTAFLILAVSPGAASFCLVNMEISFHKPTAMQARWELGTSSETDGMSA